MGHQGHCRKSGPRQQAKLQPEMGSQVAQAGSPAPVAGLVCRNLVPPSVKWGRNVPYWGCQDQNTSGQLTLWEWAAGGGGRTLV